MKYAAITTLSFVLGAAVACSAQAADAPKKAVTLTDSQMDKITAGAYGDYGSFLLNAYSFIGNNVGNGFGNGVGSGGMSGNGNGTGNGNIVIGP